MLMNRLNDLDAQVQALSRQAGRGGAANAGGPVMPGSVPAGAASADLEVRLTQIQDQIRTLTGEVETQGNEVAQMKTENQRMIQDMQMRLNDLEAKVGGGSTQQSSGPAPQAAETPAATQSGGTLGTLVPGPNGSVPAGTSSGSPEADYAAAYNELGQGDYAGAEAGFTAFLRQYPKQALAPQAEFWLGETFYARGMMDQAAAKFADTYKQYPNGAKAPDSLLKLGMSLGRLGKVQQACLTFAELNRQFPAASSKVKATAGQERAHFKCQ